MSGPFLTYTKARSLDEALGLLQLQPARIIAGGTDLLLEPRHGGCPYHVIDISRVAELDGIEFNMAEVRIGAATRMADIAGCDRLSGSLAVLAQGAAQVGSIQIRHQATLGGNLCHASPSADTAAPLLALDAWLEIASAYRTRQLPLKEFFFGPGQTALQAGEVLSHVVIPQPSPSATGEYVKLSRRRAMDLAIVGVCVVLERLGGRPDPRIALAAVAPTPMRAELAEAWLRHSEPWDAATLHQAACMAAEASSPIDDIRGSAAYRREMVRNLTERILGSLVSQVVELRSV
jgi:CO/xanthine dehydrogenase FAD-binding subunit